MRQFQVTIPIAGHAVVYVNAMNKKEAEKMALAKASMEDLGDWDFLERFNSGNVCHCPQPWIVEVEDLGEAE